uniref:Pecanex-like protein n=1 Tax=Echinostoma caproni TaxID=27848 RepID=A0A183B0M3_9TREM
LDTDRDELVSYLQSPDSDIFGRSNDAVPAAVCLGSAAHFNFAVLSRHQRSESCGLEHVVDAVCLACLNHLARCIWQPVDFSSTLEKLSTHAVSHPSDLAATGDSQVGSPARISDHSSKALKIRSNSDSVTPFLPPLATPLMDHSIPYVDDSRFFSCRPTSRRITRSNRLRSSELNDNSCELIP